MAGIAWKLLEFLCSGCREGIPRSRGFPERGYTEASAPQPSSNQFGTVFGLTGAVASPMSLRFGYAQASFDSTGTRLSSSFDQKDPK